MMNIVMFKCSKCGKEYSGPSDDSPPCPNCGYLGKDEKFDFKYNSDPAKQIGSFCPDCGTKTDSESELCPKCGAYLPLDTNQTLSICSFCGGSYDFGDKYCRFCGNKTWFSYN